MQVTIKQRLISLRQWTNAAGAVVGSAVYDPFGGVLSRQGFTSPWRFAGE